MKKIIVCLAVALFMGWMCATFALAQEKWALGTSGAGSGPYAWGGTISRVLNKAQNSVRFSSQSTGGFNENVLLVMDGKIPVGQQGGSGLMDAYDGNGTFKGKPNKRLRFLFPFVLAPAHFATREASDIKTLTDMKGKKINIGLPAQITRIENEHLLQLANIKLDEIKVFQMATGDGLTALQDKVIDGTINYYSAGHGGLQELAINTKIRLVGFPDDIIEKMEALRGMLKFTIPAKTYKSQDDPVKTFALANVLFCRDDLSEDLVYTVTKAFWSNLDELQKDSAFKGMTLDFAYSPKMRVPYHPGVLRYFKEVGLVK